MPARQPEGQPGLNHRCPPPPPSWSAIFRFHNRAFTIAAGCLPPIAYLIYVANYSVKRAEFAGRTADNVLFLINSGLKGHLSFSQLWSQWNESRLLPTRLVILVFSYIDHWDIKAEILFTVVIDIGAYVLFLFIMAQYLRGLSPVPTLVVGAIWFSFGLRRQRSGRDADLLADRGLLPGGDRGRVAPTAATSNGLAGSGRPVLLAVAASLTALAGFLVWPVGLLCLAWASPWTRRTLYECLSWLGAGIVTTAVYLPGYHLSGGAGRDTRRVFHQLCRSPSGPLLPVPVGHEGSVVPGGDRSQILSHVSVKRYEALGLVLLVVAIYVAVQSVRRRGHGEQMPLPLAMITFGFLWDIMTVIGRSSYNLDTALSNNRFVLPNLLLLTGIFVYALGRAELLWEPVGRSIAKRRRRILSLVQDALGQLRLDMKYLMFDLEATRRERDEYRRKLAEEQ